MPVTPARIADTADGTGFSASGSFGPNSTRSLQVTGRADVPTTNVGAVVLDIAGSSTANTVVSAYPADEDRGAIGTLSIAGQESNDSTTVMIRPSSDGKIKLYNRAGTTRLNVDVQGYFTKTSADGSTGGFVPTTPERMVDSVASKRVPGKLNGGTTYSVQLGGENSIPADAIGVYANVRVDDANVDGGLRIGPSDKYVGYSSPTLVSYDVGMAYDTGAAIALGVDGKIKLWTADNAKIDVFIDVQGYFTAGTQGGGFTPLSNVRAYDSASSAEGDLQPNEARIVTVAGRYGVPGDGTAGAAALAVMARDWTRPGQISVVSAELADDNGTSNLQFDGVYDGVVRQSTSVVELSQEGEVTIRNKSDGIVRVTLDYQGWFFEPDGQLAYEDEMYDQEPTEDVSDEPAAPANTDDSPEVTMVAEGSGEEPINLTQEIRELEQQEAQAQQPAMPNAQASSSGGIYVVDGLGANWQPCYAWSARGKILRTYTRKHLDSRQVGSKATFKCGKQNRTNSGGYGFRHTKFRHMEDFKNILRKEKLPTKYWEHLADKYAYVSLKSPTRAVRYSKSFCYQASIIFKRNGVTTKSRKSAVFVGKTGRLVTSIRPSTKDGCPGASGTALTIR